jgi:hypothetical protein
VVGTVICDLGMPPFLGIPRLPHNTVTVECEGGKIELYNYILPTLYRSIKDVKRDMTSRVEKAYTFVNGEKGGRGEDWWMSYRYHLEAFVDLIKGRNPQICVSTQDSVVNMEWSQNIYAKV